VGGGAVGGAGATAGGLLGGGTGGLNAAPTDAAGGEAERAIVEADIVQVAGNRLYALSRVAGLSVIDIERPAELRLLGRYRAVSGTPFEMYLRDGVAVVMFSGWGQYASQSDGGYQWVQTSKVVALDIADPAAIQQIGSFDVAGEVSDSRLVGDVMYVVGYQDGYCWGCAQNQPLTSVLSLNLADPRAIRQVDELELTSSSNTWGGGRRSISVTSQRIFIAGPEYGQAQPTGSTIQVVDISDPSGELVAGTQVTVAGQITSRWQIDEYQNVLRVVSQPWQWSATAPSPKVQTFTVVSSQELRPLGSTDIRMPANEQLRSVRFDGPRGYAITAERTDPLFTLDLSDPARPRQAGELEMPGWIYHMEPRGERVIGLGYDQGNPEGSITVSVFDVSNLESPRMLSRVNFGGSWAYLPEDQDRIHKSFKILDELGLILVPFSGYSGWDAKSYCATPYRSGIQLVDFAGDTLTARGRAPARGEARRALVHGGNLLAISDEAVDAFDIANRSAPAPLGQLNIARNVNRALPLSNGFVARINQDWYTQKSTVDLVPLDAVDRPDLSSGELDLSQALKGEDDCAYNTWIQDAFVSGTQLNLRYNRYDYRNDVYTNTSGVLVVDAADPARPSILSQLEWPIDSGSDGVSSWYAFSNYYNYGFTGAQTSSVRTERALVMLEQRYRYQPNLGFQGYDIRLQVVDLTDPRAPSLSSLMLPEAEGYAGLVPDGEDVLLSHYETGTQGRARFYVDRVDLGDPKQPKLTDKINVPGALLHHDRAHGRAVTSELVKSEVTGISAGECYARFAQASFVTLTDPSHPTPTDICTGFTQRLQLVRYVSGGAVLEDTQQLGDRDRITSSSLGDGRVVAVLGRGYYYGGPFGGGLVDCLGPGCGGYNNNTDPAEVLVLGGLASGSFEVGRLTVDDGPGAWWGFYGSPPVYAHGTKALVQSQLDVAILDISNASEPKLLRSLPLFGYPQSFSSSGNTLLFALGTNGVQRIEL
jgi:hypothetical protein